MKKISKLFIVPALMASLFSCSKDEQPQQPQQPKENKVTLQFVNSYKASPLTIGNKDESSTTSLMSANGQVHKFSEIKYIISNIRLIKTDGTEVAYNTNNLDTGATIVDQAKKETLQYVLQAIPAGEYKEIKFGLGIKNELNKIDETKFPVFYKKAEKNDTKMMWEWGAGYRFVKIEGFYDNDNKNMSIHIGSTEKKSPTGLVQGVDAYREIKLPLTKMVVVGEKAPMITIAANLELLLSGITKITLTTGDGDTDNATPNIHTAKEMLKFTNNLGGDGVTNTTGMFSIQAITN